MARLDNGFRVIHAPFVKVEDPQKILPCEPFSFESGVRHDPYIRVGTYKPEPYFIQRRVFGVLPRRDIIDTAFNPSDRAVNLHLVLANGTPQRDISRLIICRHDHGDTVVLRGVLERLTGLAAVDEIYAVRHTGLSTVGSPLDDVQTFSEGDAGVAFFRTVRSDLLYIEPRHSATSLKSSWTADL